MLMLDPKFKNNCLVNNYVWYENIAVVVVEYDEKLLPLLLKVYLLMPTRVA